MTWRLFPLPSKRVDFHPKGNTYFGETAFSYEEKRQNASFWLREQEVLRALLDQLPTGMKVLDIPVGTGRFLKDFAGRSHDVLGIDASQDMVTLAQEKKSENSRVTLSVGDSRQLIIGDSTFDLVVSFRFLFSIVSFQDSLTALSEISRVCRKFAILELPWGKRRALKVKENMRHGLTRGEMLQLITDFGFEVISEHTVKQDWNGTWGVFLLQRVNLDN
jgi:ubiquinone/menaquinone biosynthesis C-methylase UbiE